MSSDFPTLSEVGEANARAHLRRKDEVYGESADYLLNYLDSKYERGE